jgi:hypothetical protein
VLRQMAMFVTTKTLTGLGVKILERRAGGAPV